MRMDRMAPTDHPCRSKNATPSVGAKVKGALSKLGICRIILRTIAGALTSVIHPPISVRCN